MKAFRSSPVLPTDEPPKNRPYNIIEQKLDKIFEKLVFLEANIRSLENMHYRMMSKLLELQAEIQGNKLEKLPPHRN